MIRRLVDTRQTYGYRRITALLRRELAEDNQPRVNHKRVYRIMKQNGLLLARQSVRLNGGDNILDFETHMTLRFDDLDARLRAIENDLRTIKTQVLGQRPPISPQFVARRLGLTPGEGQTDAVLAEGKTLPEIAAARQRA